MTLAPKSSLFRGFLPVFTRLIFSAGCIALAVWGKRFCREVMDPMVAPGPYHDLTGVAAELSWGLFFGPFALLGLYVLVRACVVFYRALAARRRPEAIEILPPLSDNAVEAGEGAAGRFRSAPMNEPLDDATRRGLDRLAALAVRVSGILVGTIFVGLGVMGFLWTWTQAHSTLLNVRPNSLISLVFPAVSGMSVLVGAYILRETFARPETAWLTPLRVFGAIVSKKLLEEEEKNKKA